jgi:hypothetical protein
MKEEKKRAAEKAKKDKVKAEKLWVLWPLLFCIKYAWEVVAMSWFHLFLSVPSLIGMRRRMFVMRASSYEFMLFCNSEYCS